MKRASATVSKNLPYQSIFRLDTHIKPTSWLYIRLATSIYLHYLACNFYALIVFGIPYISRSVVHDGGQYVHTFVLNTSRCCWTSSDYGRWVSRFAKARYRVLPKISALCKFLFSQTFISIISRWSLNLTLSSLTLPNVSCIVLNLPN